MTAPKVRVTSLNQQFQVFRANALQRRRFKRAQFYAANENEGDDDEASVGLLLADAADEEMANGIGDVSPPAYVIRAEALADELNSLNQAVDQLEQLSK